jgi:hypothetical protein
MKRSILQWAALAGLAAALAVPACGTSITPDKASKAIEAAREANAAALATCDALETERAKNAKLDAFCAELQTHANALAKLDQITAIVAEPAPADGGTGGAQ